LKLDDSCIANPKSENLNWTAAPVDLRPIRNFGFRICDAGIVQFRNFHEGVSCRHASL